MIESGSILVVGGASVDRVRSSGEALITPGGAALFTALAARQAGAKVSFFGFRPDPLPELFSAPASLVPWHGPPCQLEDLPHFEIVYQDDGNARLAAADWGTEETLDPDMIPDELLNASLIHIAAIHAPELQIRFVEALRKRSPARISAGTYGYMARRAPDTVRALMESVDLFFMNEFEEQLIFGEEGPTVRPGQLLIVTRGAQGSDVWQGDHCTRVPISPATPVDLTGAGDSICGGTLAGLMRGMHPTEAANLGAAVAAITIEDAGMQALLRTAPATIETRRQATQHDPRVQVNRIQVDKIGTFIRDFGELRAFDFMGPLFPEEGHPKTVDYLFSSILHQFGFWSPANGVYHRPTYAQFDNERLKGSDYCFASFKRVLDNEPKLLEPRNMSTLRWQDTVRIFRTDDGTVPMPVLTTHHSLARGYGRDMWELGLSPTSLLEQANEQPNPVRYLISVLDHITGYREDPLRKKTMLLILALGQRPERFLDLRNYENVSPIIDYHLMRSCLRTGLVEVGDELLRENLARRRLLTPNDERVVRRSCHEAIDSLRRTSGRSIGAIDWFFFSARRRCPEMEDPDCNVCPLLSVCKRDKAMFQPVYRTTFY